MIHDWLVPDWPAPPRVHAFVTTRSGGVSQGEYASMNLSASGGDDPVFVARNRAIVRELLPAEPRWLAQVHGVDVVEVDDGSSETRPRADASVAHGPNRVCTVLTADCMPLLLCDTKGEAVAVAHAGWRGLAAGILEATIAAMRVPAVDLSVWVGPAIGPRAFEVGPDVYAAYCGTDPGASEFFSPLREYKWLADLPGIARRRLAASGVHDVSVDGACTFTESARFFSYRRDKRSGRMALVAWLAPAQQDAV